MAYKPFPLSTKSAWTNNSVWILEVKSIGTGVQFGFVVEWR